MPRPANLAAFLAFVPVAASADAAFTITFDMEDVITADYDCRESGSLAVIYVASEPTARRWRRPHRRASGERIGRAPRLGPIRVDRQRRGRQLIDTLEDETVLDCGPAER